MSNWYPELTLTPENTTLVKGGANTPQELEAIKARVADIGSIDARRLQLGIHTNTATGESTLLSSAIQPLGVIAPDMPWIINGQLVTSGEVDDLTAGTPLQNVKPGYQAVPEAAAGAVQGAAEGLGNAVSGMWDSVPWSKIALIGGALVAVYGVVDIVGKKVSK